ncbi:MAG: hypothetical protein NWQ55_06990 [Salibacteraceae bacterium]|nr:hypothetical protein [Salibacteraceae bacterium]MDP4935682.1 hypothetical protein [Salibacteraceae bacterium]MDP4964799.1 hypothetical protein [Salibacteraceae bacterium]
MKFIFTLGLLISSSVIVAQDFKDSIDQIEVKLETCLSDSATTFAAASRVCTLDAMEELIGLIGKIHGALQKEVNELGKQKMNDSQEAWIKYFEKESLTIYHMREEKIGSLYLNIQINDRYELALNRAQHLANTLWLYQNSTEDKFE